MRSIYYLSSIIFLVVMMSSCVSKKKFSQAQAQLERYKSNLNDCYQARDSIVNVYEMTINSMQNEYKESQNTVNSLKERLDHIKSTNTNLLDRLADLSVISKAGAKNLKKTLQSLNKKSVYIKELNKNIHIKDSIALALVTNLKSSLANVNDEDIQIEVRDGVVYISLSDKMLYRSGSYQVDQDAKVVISKIAKILKDHKHLDIMVKGYTDNVPIATNCIKDNWDLSVLRATSVVRMLQEDYGVAPQRLTAAGRGEYAPKASNETAEGRSLNRRTEVILLPNLEEFFSLVNESME